MCRHQRRREPADDGGENRGNERCRHDAQIDEPGAGVYAGDRRLEDAARQAGEDQTRDASHSGQQGALGHEQTSKAQPTDFERQADGDLALPPRGADEKQTSHVRACDEEDDGRNAVQPERDLDILCLPMIHRDHRVWRGRDDGPLGAVLVAGVGVVIDGVQLCRELFALHPWLEPSENRCPVELTIRERRSLGALNGEDYRWHVQVDA